MTTIRRAAGAACVLGLLLAVVPARADIRVEVRESVNGSTPAKVVHWFGPGRTMRDDGEIYIVTRLDLGKIYIVDRQARQYRVVDLNLDPSANAPKLEVTRTDDTRQINGWSTRRYRISGPATGDMVIDIWASTEVDVDIADFHQLMVRLGGRAGSEWLNAYRSLPGFPIMQEVELARPGLRLHSRSKVVSIEQVAPKPHTYRPPEGYTRVN